MTRTNVLNTATINYLELIGNGKTYRVPPYQRDYAWTEEAWEDFWNDILDLRRQTEGRHYMGALVVQGQTDREFTIIDGQQRLATLSLLSLAVIDKLQRMAGQGIDEEANLERAKQLRNRFIGEKDPASLIESSRLNLSRIDDAFYQDYLVQLRSPLNPRGLAQSNARLWECFRYFSERLDALADVQEDGEALARILSETTARGLLFILITVEDEFDAYTVFETLNARGLELTTADLLKNYLFSKVRVQGDLDALQRRWQALIATVTQERFSDFLRYHLLCEQAGIRRDRLFKLIRDRVTTSQQVFELLRALEARAELFSALADANHEFWMEQPEAKRYIRDLVLFRARQVTPLLFAAWERFSPDDFIRMLKLATPPRHRVVSFRYLVSRRNPNRLELVYPEAAKAILDGHAPRPGTVSPPASTTARPAPRAGAARCVRSMWMTGRSRATSPCTQSIQGDARSSSSTFSADWRKMPAGSHETPPTATGGGARIRGAHPPAESRGLLDRGILTSGAGSRGQPDRQRDAARVDRVRVVVPPPLRQPRYWKRVTRTPTSGRRTNAAPMR